MRGGAIPLAVWGLVLAVLFALNVVWTGKGLNAAMAAFAVVATFGFAAAFLFLRPREAFRRGDPDATEEPAAIPSASIGSVLLAVGAAAIVYGFAFGHFLIYFGAGLMVVSIGILAREVTAQRRAVRAWRARAPERERERR